MRNEELEMANNGPPRHLAMEDIGKVVITYGEGKVENPRSLFLGSTQILSETL